VKAFFDTDIRECANSPSSRSPDADPGPVGPAPIMGPGSAEQREGRCAASGTRVEYAFAAVWPCAHRAICCDFSS